MKRASKNGVLLLAAVGLAGFGLLNLLAYSHARSMTRFTGPGARTDKPERLAPASKLKVLLCGVRVERPESDKAPADLDPLCQSVSIPAGQGVALAAWYCGRGKEAPLVILFHGYAEEKSVLIPEAAAFLQLGASVMLVDFQGAGASTGSGTTIGVREARDVAAAVRYARERLPHGRQILFGQSMGGVAVLRAVYEKTVAPDAVILEGVFDTLLNTVRNRFASMGVPSCPNAELLVFWGGVQLGFNGFSHRPVDYAGALRCPLLLMHGDEDLRVKVSEARRVFEAAPGPKAFKLFRGVGHESFVARCPDEWREAVAPCVQPGTAD